MIPVGVTEDGKTVISNVFKMHESRGVPLDAMIETFHDAGYVIDWIGFYQDALTTGWKEETVVKRIQYALIDVFGRAYADDVISRLNDYRRQMSNV